MTEKQSDKQMNGNYGRHIFNCKTWWDTYQASIAVCDPMMRALSAFPITPAKVAMFLNHESTYEFSLLL
jgi:hypothetical protein